MVQCSKKNNMKTLTTITTTTQPKSESNVVNKETTNNWLFPLPVLEKEEYMFKGSVVPLALIKSCLLDYKEYEWQWFSLFDGLQILHYQMTPRGNVTTRQCPQLLNKD